MLSICEITKVAPCGFLATSPWVPCTQVSQHPTALWWGREVGAGMGPRLCPLLRGLEGLAMERKGLLAPG